MKYILTFSLFLALLTTSLFSQSNINQSLSVNSTGAAADASALLDVSATDKGMLVPRMTTAQRTAITAANALLVFDADTRSFWFFDSVAAAWREIKSGSIAELSDADGDTKIQVEESPNEDIIRFDLGGSENMVLRKNPAGAPRLELGDALNNLFIGEDAGASNTTGPQNTATGKGTLSSNTIGSRNTALGYEALRFNTIGDNNTAIGRHALTANVSGVNNTGIGFRALLSNTTGNFNTASGMDALNKNTEGLYNVANGFAALVNNTTGNGNTALGYRAMYDNTTGYSNTALGTHALNNNTTSSNLVALGDSALFNNGLGASQPYHGAYNTAVGSKALYSNTTGYGNTSTGRAALSSNTGGYFNTANGYKALYSNTTGNYNTAIGTSALINNTTGYGNTANGIDALFSNTTGDYNSALGHNADVSSGNHANATAIGARAQAGASNCLVLGSIDGVNGATASVNVGIGTTSPDVRLQVDGGTDVSLAGGGFIETGTSTGLNLSIDNNEIMARNNGATSILFLNNDGGDVIIGENGGDVGIGRSPTTHDLEVNGTASKSSAGDWLANSDARLKKNISPLNSQLMLQNLLALRGVTYEWDDDKTGSKRPKGIQYGFTAQNIQEVFPTLVEEDKLGYLQTAYGTYDAMTVEAIRALHEENGELRMENGELRRDVDVLKSQLEKIADALAGAGITVEK